jgi:hypothetical protein
LNLIEAENLALDDLYERLTAEVALWTPGTSLDETDGKR